MDINYLIKSYLQENENVEEKMSMWFNRIESKTDIRKERESIECSLAIA